MDLVPFKLNGMKQMQISNGGQTLEKKNKNNLLWMLQLEDNIDLKKIIIESYINKFNINYSYNNSTTTINNYLFLK